MSGPGPASDRTTGAAAPTKVAHLTTTEMSLRFLLLAQLRSVLDTYWAVAAVKHTPLALAELTP